MIKSMKVTNHIGEFVTLELGFPEKSGFLVRDIGGLGPVKADINIAQLSTLDGGKYTNSRVPTRNITLQLDFLENPTIEETRHFCYRYFPVKRLVGLEIETDTKIVKTQGYVEANDVDIFSKKESANISLICTDPAFYSLLPIHNIFSGVTPLFEFPFSNESLTESLIEFGTTFVDKFKDIVYTGGSDIGVLLEIEFNTPVSGLYFGNSLTEQIMELDSGRVRALTPVAIFAGIRYDFIAGDRIEVSTLKGNKYITVARAGITYNIYNALGRNTDWLELSAGKNQLYFGAATGSEGIHFKLVYSISYEGV